MAKEELLEFEGIVIDALPKTLFRVELENGHVILATIPGKMRKNNSRVLLSDRVSVEVSRYDIDRGRIIFRHK